MTNLPIFETAKVIESQYHPDAHVVLYHGLAQELLATLLDLQTRVAEEWTMNQYGGVKVMMPYYAIGSNRL
ncbi:MAG: hypothetical protein HYR71_10145 [Chloroflexi bacterium]|nr:hypothetical protein [Chloroflexota bacterium]